MAITMVFVILLVIDTVLFWAGLVYFARALILYRERKILLQDIRDTVEGETGAVLNALERIAVALEAREKEKEPARE